MSFCWSIACAFLPSWHWRSIRPARHCKANAWLYSTLELSLKDPEESYNSDRWHSVQLCSLLRQHREKYKLHACVRENSSFLHMRIHEHTHAHAYLHSNSLRTGAWGGGGGELRKGAWGSLRQGGFSLKPPLAQYCFSCRLVRAKHIMFTKTVCVMYHCILWAL